MLKLAALDKVYVKKRFVAGNGLFVLVLYNIQKVKEFQPVPDEFKELKNNIQLILSLSGN